MSSQVEKLEHNMAKITIEVPVTELEKALQSAYVKERAHISLPGFRKGKVPRQMVEKMYGEKIFFEQAAEILVNQEYPKAYDECGLHIVSRPEIEIVQMEKGQPFIFTATVAVKPDVKLGAYKGMQVEAVSTRVTAKEIDAEIEREREKNARTIEVTNRGVQEQDMITLDFEGFVDGEAFEGGKGTDYPLTVGSGSFIPGFEEQLIGAKLEEKIEVKVTFPKDYQAAELAGKDATFLCCVHTIKEKELPELNDEFASEVSECETLEDYKAEVKNRLKERKTAEKQRRQEDQAVELAVDNAEIDVPKAMLEMQTEQLVDGQLRRLSQQGISSEQYFQLTGLTYEKMCQEMEPQADRRIRTRLVLEAIVEAENIQIADARVEEEIKTMAEAYHMEPGKLKDMMSEREVEQLKEDLAVQEAVTFLADTAKEKKEDKKTDKETDEKAVKKTAKKTAKKTEEKTVKKTEKKTEKKADKKTAKKTTKKKDEKKEG